LFNRIFGLLFGFWLTRARRNARPIAWKPPISRLNKQMPWTMRELHPRVTKIRGNSANQYREFELVFDRFRLRIVLLGSELDEILFVGPGEGWGTRVDHVQKELALKSGRSKEIQPVILNYNELDEFLQAQYPALNEYYSNETKLG
jgi:hypothetical protein